LLSAWKDKSVFSALSLEWCVGNPRNVAETESSWVLGELSAGLARKDSDSASCSRGDLLFVALLHIFLACAVGTAGDA